MAGIFAVSGLKNSGKTTLIEKLTAFFSGRGLRVAVIKHDGHDFEPDVPGTDSWRHRRAGARGTAVFSANRVMLIKEEPDVRVEELIACFPDADLIILEGFKYSAYPKIEMIREADFPAVVCDPSTVWAYVSGRDGENCLPGSQIPVFYRDHTEELGEYLLKRLRGDG